jgi:hypothetical protein
VRAEEVAGAEGGGGEGGREEAAGARAAAAAARAQTDHGLIRLHASGEGIRPGKRTASGSIEESANALGKIRGGIECCGRGGSRLRPLFQGREDEEWEAWATGGGGVLSVELRAVGLCRSLLRLRG